VIWIYIRLSSKSNQYVNQKQEQIDTLHKLDERIEAIEEGEEEREREEATTTNGVF
jgi:hypothetical protein